VNPKRIITTDQELLVSYGYLKAKGISKELLYKNVSLGIWKKQTTAPGSKKGKYVLHSSLTEAALSKLPTREELEKIAETEQLREEIRRKSIDNKDVEFGKANLLTALESYSTFMPEALERVHQSSTETATIISKNYAILISCNELRDFNVKLKDILCAYHQVRALDSNLKEISEFNTTSLRQRMDAIKDKGINGIIDKRIGRERSKRKFRKELQILAEKIWSETNYTYEQVKISLDHYCEEKGMEKISVSAIKDHFRKPEVKNLLSGLRRGKKWYNSTLRGHVRRSKPKYTGSKWVIDGTPLQFIVKEDHTGKQIRIEIFAVIDVHSSKIVGYSFSKSETSATVINSLKIAYDNTGYLPKELVSDNSAAITSQETQKLFDRMKRLGVIIRPARVDNAQDKEIEQFFRTFHNFCRVVPGWIGGNITSRSWVYRPSKESVSRVYRKNGFPNEDTFKALIIKLIDQYNITGLKGKASPALKHEKDEKKYVIYPKPSESAFLFWPQRIARVANSMVIRTSGQETFCYSIHNPEDVLKLNGQDVLIKFNFNLTDEIHLFDVNTEMYLCSCPLLVQPNSAQIERSEEDNLQMIKQGTHNEALGNFIKAKFKEKVNELKAITGSDEINYIGVLEHRKEDTKKSEFSEEKRYYNINGIDPDKVDMKKFAPIHSKEWETGSNDIDYSKNPYKETGDCSPINSNEEELDI
jgi:transposase InsO family protein